VIVNLYVDRLMLPRPTSAAEVWSATQDESKLFTEAAHRVGLSDRQYQEFRRSLLDGKALYVKLPRRLDAMSGNHGGSVYAVKNAVLTSSEMGWKVRLADGTEVYVPQACGNLAVLHPTAVADAKTHRLTPSIAVVPRPPETPVSLTPPQADAAVVPPSTAAVGVAPSSSQSGPRGIGVIPYIFSGTAGAVGGILTGLSGGGGGGGGGTCPP
jgi:hypothetical protein